MSALGLLYEALPWRRQKEIQERREAVIRSLIEALHRALEEVFSSLTGIRESWIGWCRLHEKVKREALQLHLMHLRDPHFRHYIQLNRWWYNEA